MSLLIESLKGKVAVSCQAREGEPFNAPEFIAEFAKSAEMGGASSLRINGGLNIKRVKEKVNLPIIGIRKRYIENSDVYITPGIKDIKEVINAGADIVALDGTTRERPDGEHLQELIEYCHSKGIPVLADIASEKDAAYALSCGSDFLATTLAGYTEHTKNIELPDFGLLKSLTDKYSIPIFLEGGITRPEHVLKALGMGAYGVIIGKAITMPHYITTLFVEETKKISRYKEESK